MGPSRDTRVRLHARSRTPEAGSVGYIVTNRAGAPVDLGLEATNRLRFEGIL